MNQINNKFVEITKNISKRPDSSSITVPFPPRTTLIYWAIESKNMNNNCSFLHDLFFSWKWFVLTVNLSKDTWQLLLVIISSPTIFLPNEWNGFFFFLFPTFPLFNTSHCTKNLQIQPQQFYGQKTTPLFFFFFFFFNFFFSSPFFLSSLQFPHKTTTYN